MSKLKIKSDVITGTTNDVGILLIWNIPISEKIESVYGKLLLSSLASVKFAKEQNNVNIRFNLNGSEFYQLTFMLTENKISLQHVVDGLWTTIMRIRLIYSPNTCIDVIN